MHVEQRSKFIRAAEKKYTNHSKDILIGTSQADNWWAPLKAALFGHDSGITPFSKPDETFPSHPSEKAEIVSNFFLVNRVMRRLFHHTLVFPNLP